MIRALDELPVTYNDGGRHSRLACGVLARPKACRADMRCAPVAHSELSGTAATSTTSATSCQMVDKPATSHTDGCERMHLPQSVARLWVAARALAMISSSCPEALLIVMPSCCLWMVQIECFIAYWLPKERPLICPCYA